MSRAVAPGMAELEEDAAALVDLARILRLRYADAAPTALLGARFR